MGFFSKMFYTPPPREEWSEIALNISKNADQIAHRWFKEAVEKLEDNSLEVKNKKLGGEGDLAIKAYSLFISANFIASNEYIARSDGKDFADILFAYVCGNQIEEVLEFFERYYDADGGELIARFSGDVSSYILEEKLAFAVLFVGPTTIKLGLMINFSIAHYFGYDSKAREFAQKIENF